MSEKLKQMDRKTLLQNALEAVEKMQVRLNEAEGIRTEPIAVIGASCRFPGGIRNLEDYWDLLRDGRCGVREIPPDRWDVEAYYDPDPKAPGKMCTRYGGFLENVDRFDAHFFGISPREATSLDPQQRLLLEVAWEALEDACIAPNGLLGTDTGVFIGITTTDYAKKINLAEPSNTDVYAATGNALNAAAGRLSFFLGLQGPCMAIDSACSSSLVAVHEACQSLRTRECDVALGGGVNVILNPTPFILFSKWGMLSPDERCKAFDAAADGFVRGEGCGAVVLKRYSDAKAAGDRILAIIRGNAVNQDGRSSGLTVPNGLAQQAVIRRALQVASFEPSAISYVEAHGTGTPIGDPIEVEALAAVYGQGRDQVSPLEIGSVKTNLGHLESASGMAGLLKVILCLRHKTLVPHLHLNALNPRIVWESMPIIVPTTLHPWEGIQGRRIAGVSSFGFSGTNAHLILEEPPAAASGKEQPIRRPMHLLALSAQTRNALQELPGIYEDHLARHPEQSISDICHSANTGRMHFRHRLAIVGEDAETLREGLRRAQQNLSSCASGAAKSSDRPRVAFLFTGQGSQYVGMGAELYSTHPTFRRVMDHCNERLMNVLPIPLLDVLYPKAGATSPLDQTAYAQPALFALEVALAELWKSWGVQPDIVIGHSVGEYAAACVAGVFTIDDGLKLIAERGRLMQALQAGGRMVAVDVDAETAAAAIRGYEHSISVAVINAPDSVVFSGTESAMTEVLAKFDKARVRIQPLTVSHAFHSPLMDPMLEPFRKVASSLSCSTPSVELISNLTGNSATGKDIDWPDYWVKHVRNPVLFSEGMQTLAQSGCGAHIELGPNPVLLGLGKRSISNPEIQWLPSLRKGTNDWSQILDSLARLYVSGGPVDLNGLDHEYPCSKTALPNYPFQRERFWIESESEPAASGSSFRLKKSEWPLLGNPISLPFSSDTNVWLTEISTDRFPYLRDHRVQNGIIVPATFYNEIALEAAAELFGTGPVVLSEIENRAPIILTENSRYSLQVAVQESGHSRALFEVFGRPDPNSEWTLHVSARLSQSSVEEQSAPDINEVVASCPQQISGSDFYKAQAEKGNQWGPCFRGVQTIWRRDNEALSRVELPENLHSEAKRYRFHPAWSDAAGHVLTMTIPDSNLNEGMRGAFVGGGIDQVRYYRSPAGTEVWAHARLRETAARSNVLTGDVCLFDDQGVFAEAIGAHLWYLDLGKPEPNNRIDRWLLKPEWERISGTQDAKLPSAGGAWLIFADRGGYGQAVKETLEMQGRRCTLVFAGAEPAVGGDRTSIVRPDVPDDFEAVLRSAGKQKWEGVLHLWTLDLATTSDIHDLDHARTLGCAAVMYLVQQLCRHQHTAKVWLATKGTQPVTDKIGVTNPGASGLWGMSRTLALEHGEIWGGIIDLDPEADLQQNVQNLTHDLLHKSEDQLAYRANQKYGIRLVRHTGKAAKDFRGRPDAGYLITGGLGGLGLTVARWLVEKGARRLILMGRSALPPRSQWKNADKAKYPQIDAIRELEQLGAAVHLAAVDVGDERQISQFFQGYADEGWPPIRGIIHAAGIMQYEPFLNHSTETLKSILRPKVEGAWLLHQLSQDLPLDFFVFFSSASSLLSSPLLSSYAAANSFMDSLAHYRTALGKPALSINWGLWSEVGMGAAFASQERSTADLSEMARISPRQGLQALESLIGQTIPQAGVLPVDWQKWRELYPALAGSPFLSHLMETKQVDTPLAQEQTNALLFSEDKDKRREAVLVWLSEQVGSVLRLPSSSIDRSEPLNKLGLDSLMAVELKNRIEMNLSVVLPMVRFLQGPSVSDLTHQIIEESASQLGADSNEAQDSSGAPADISGTSPESWLARLPEMNDEEVNSLLNDLLST